MPRANATVAGDHDPGLLIKGLISLSVMDWPMMLVRVGGIAFAD